MKKYYFITYQADSTRQAGMKSEWNECTNLSPMEFVKEHEKAEQESDKPYYRNFVVLNTCEITKEEYEKYKDEF